MRKKIMANLIKSLPFIGRKYRVMLKKAKITTTGEILEHGICRTSRGNLANELGISERLIFKWVNLADLLRVKGIGKRYLKLLDKIGIGNLNKLSKQDSDNILQKINSLDQEDLKKIKRKPSKKTIRRWIEESRKTRKIVQNLSDDISVLGSNSREKVFTSRNFILDLIWSEEWENLMVLGERIKAGSVFDITKLKLELEEIEKKGIEKKNIQKEILKAFENNEYKDAVIKQFPETNRSEITKIIESGLAILKKEKKQLDYEYPIISEIKNSLNNNLFLYVLGNFIILAAQFPLDLKNKEQLNESIVYHLSPEVKEQIKKQIISEKAEFEINQVKKRLKKIQLEISKLPRSETLIIKSEKYLKELNDMLINVKINSQIHKFKADKLIIRIYRQYKKVLQNNLSILAQNSISTKTILRSFPTNKAILKSEKFSSVLVNEIYKSYGMGGVL